MTLRPRVRTIPLAGMRPATILQTLRDRGWRLLLESGRGGRFSYVMGPSRRRLQYDGIIAYITRQDGFRIWEGDPWDGLHRFANLFNVEPHSSLRNFTGGVVGFLSYDMARTLERLPESTTDDLHLPLLRFDFTDRFIEIDHAEGLLSIVWLCPPGERNDGWMDSVLVALAAAVPPPDSRGSGDIPVNDHDWRSNLTRGEFEAIVRQAREYIYKGDVFQANLSLRLDTECSAPIGGLYALLRTINPSPYMACLDYDDFGVACASPELLLKVRDGGIETRPIAGTRPRGVTYEEDVLLAEELVANDKERAEHVMLVDLERNDIGRVAEFGSVRVDEFMIVERYSHVNHIVSHVSGTLAEGCSTVDALRALFPGGTITGAPKVRSMEIIDELEPTRRSLYTGSIGWIGFDGACEFNIVIRTVLLQNGRAYVQAGAGIVADSDPSAEYVESMRKARAGMEAVTLTQRNTVPAGRLQ